MLLEQQVLLAKHAIDLRLLATPGGSPVPPADGPGAFAQSGYGSAPYAYGADDPNAYRPNT